MKPHSRSQSRHLLTLAALCAMATGPTQAAITAYADSATFNAALGLAGLAGIDQGIPGLFEGASDPSSLVAGAVTITGMNDGIGGSFFVGDGSYGFTTSFYTHQLSSYLNAYVNTVVLTFAVPIRGFSFVGNVMNPPLGDAINPDNWPDTGFASVMLTTQVGDTVTVASPIFSNFGSLPVAPPLSFNGVVSDVAFSSITLSAVQAGNLQFTQLTVAAVPEPAGTAMWLVGLGGLSLLVRRRVS
jgi:hypothetical protein